MGFSVVIAVSGADPFHLSTVAVHRVGQALIHTKLHISELGAVNRRLHASFPRDAGAFPLLKALRNARSSPQTYRKRANVGLQQLRLADSTVFWFLLTQEIIADALSLRVPYVDRILQKLRDEGLVQMKNKGIHIQNVEEFILLADFQVRLLADATDH